MRRTILLNILLTLVAAPPLHAGTFQPTPIAPDLGLDALTRGVARSQLNRDVFSDPWSTVTIGSVDLYSVYPYVESRTFQIVSDPRWNRLVIGEAGNSLTAYDGKGQTLGALAQPRGLAVDERNRVYVADAGNDRVLVLEARTEFGDVTLAPLYEIRGLNDPHDVAYSDGGTPFVSGDDVLYVADTGRNRVVAFALVNAGARQIAAIGELGGGPGHFAGPMAIAAGRASGGTLDDVYVADAHSRRIVRLRLAGDRFQWISDVRDDADLVTSLDTDVWGNLYAAAPNRGTITKFNPDLVRVAELREGVSRPRSFDLPFVNLTDHRNGQVQRVAKANGLSVDEWSDASGMRLWTLGADVTGLSMTDGAASEARFTLTDRADVSVEIVDASSGESLSRRSAGSMNAGVWAIPLSDQERSVAASVSAPMLRLSAASSYPGGATTSAQLALHSSGAISPSRASLLGNSPNPAVAFTRISFMLPESEAGSASLRVLDASGRQVRIFRGPFSTGLNQVTWGGTDDQGHDLPAGMYFYRLIAGTRSLTRKLALVR